MQDTFQDVGTVPTSPSNPANRAIPPLGAVLVVLLLSVGVVSPPTYAAPPTVIRTTPADGDFDVDPGLTEIRVEFDQDMDHTGHSVCGGGDWFPEVVGEASWQNARTFVLPVKLKLNHDYGFNLNCPSAMNFRNAGGESAGPYSLNFATRGGSSDVPPEKHRAAFKELRRLVNEEYSYRAVRGIDWDKLFADYETRLCGAATPEQFGRYAGRMLAAAKDVHISVSLRDRWFACFRRFVSPNADQRRLPELVPEFAKRSAAVFSGRYPDGIGYILISTWRNREAGAHEQAFVALEELADCPGLIIDMRFNSGGAELVAQEFAGCFVDEPVVYAQHVNCDRKAPSGFTAPTKRVLEPSRDRPKYRGKVAVLTGRYVMSSCEAFLLMMKTVPGCRLVGEPSYGSSGNPQPHELPNGITVNLPSWKTMSPDGREWEGQGISPDIEVVTEPADFKDGDPVIAAALAYLRK